MAKKPCKIEICDKVTEHQLLGVTYYRWTVWRREIDSWGYAKEGYEYNSIMKGNCLWRGVRLSKRKALDRVAVKRVKAKAEVQRAFFSEEKPSVVQSLCTAVTEEDFA